VSERNKPGPPGARERVCVYVFTAKVDFWLGDLRTQAHQPLEKRDFLKDVTDGIPTFFAFSLGREVLHLSPSGEEPR